MNRDNDLILVTGATGNVGRHVVSGLLAKGARVRALSRNPESAGLPTEVEVVRGDLTTPRGLEKHLDDVSTVFLLWRATGPGASPQFLEAVLRPARRIVFLSSSAIRDDIKEQTNPVGKVHADIENLIRKSGLEWTFLRPGGFATNALMWWGAQIRAGNIVRWPYGAAALAPIHERDIAAVAVRALTEDGHAGAKYILTGPQSLTQREQVAILADAIGRPLRFDEISPDAAREQMRKVMPPFIVEVLLDVLTTLAKHPAPVTSTVTEITRSPACTFAQWANDHTTDFQLSSAPSVAVSPVAQTGIVAGVE